MRPTRASVTRFLNGSLAVLVATALGACSGSTHSSGSGGQSILPNAPSGPGAGSSSSTTASFVIQIPSKTSESSQAKAQQKPAYVSPSTQSISISTSGGVPSPLAPSEPNLFVANLTPTSAGCVAAAGATPLTCTLVVPVTATTGAGNPVTFNVELWDAPGASGNPLSSATIVPAIKLNANNTIKVTLNGVVNSLQLTIATPNPPTGVAATIPLTINALDADGNIIIAPGSYTTDNAGDIATVTLTDSDTSGITKLTASSVTGPGTAVSLKYNGKSLGDATITASAPGISPVSAVFSPGNASSTLYSFGALPDAQAPDDGLLNANGTLFGTTLLGGASNAGTVFSITPSGVESILHSFTGGADGSYPLCTLINVGGTLYGTTEQGGANNQGVVFSITPAGVETVLHSFGGGSDGEYPFAGLVFLGGKLYGTTAFGGTYSDGIVYSITTSGTESVLHSFSGPDGQIAYSPLIDVGGTLYGTTEIGGTNNQGIVFSITPAGAETVLYSFAGGSDGANPLAPLTNVSGTLYGTTFQGAASNAGSVFTVTPSGAESVLYSFTGGSDGKNPLSPLINVGGTLYGTTQKGGTGAEGVVYSITLSGAQTVLHSFAGGGSDGTLPGYGSLIDVNGTLYGTTIQGGADNVGAVFSLPL